MALQPPRKRRKLSEDTSQAEHDVEIETVIRDAPHSSCYSPLQTSRRKSFKPPLPAIFQCDGEVLGQPKIVTNDTAYTKFDDIKRLFPNTWEIPSISFESNASVEKGKPIKVGMCFSGGQAPGGHNVAAGLYRYLKKRNPENKLYGFIGGPRGIFTGKVMEITSESVDLYMNMGGFMMIDTGRDKIHADEQFVASKRVCDKLELDGLVVAGGDDSNTNAAVLAEYFKHQKCKTNVIGVPKTIDGDLKNEYVEVSFGFDSATKVYSSLIGNIASDLLSAKKYYHFVRLMGRSASHITLEAGLQTHANIILIGEEVAEQKKTLKDITEEVCDVVCKRASQGKNYGLVLVPEGLIEFIPEVHDMLSELNDILATCKPNEKPNQVQIASKLSPACHALFDYLPAQIQQQLLLDRDPHGNVQVSKIETERLLIQTVTEELNKRQAAGKYVGKFSTIPHFFGYEGRSVLPSNFDCTYCYALGHTAGALIEAGKTGLIAVVKDLTKEPKDWKPAGFPVTIMLHMEKRAGKMKPVIEKALVKLNGRPFKTLNKMRALWELGDFYRAPGPIQFAGEGSNAVNFTLKLERDEKFIFADP